MEVFVVRVTHSKSDVNPVLPIHRGPSRISDSRRQSERLVTAGSTVKSEQIEMVHQRYRGIRRRQHPIFHVLLDEFQVTHSNLEAGVHNHQHLLKLRRRQLRQLLLREVLSTRLLANPGINQLRFALQQTVSERNLRSSGLVRPDVALRPRIHVELTTPLLRDLTIIQNVLALTVSEAAFTQPDRAANTNIPQERIHLARGRHAHVLVAVELLVFLLGRLLIHHQAHTLRVSNNLLQLSVSSLLVSTIEGFLIRNRRSVRKPSLTELQPTNTRELGVSVDDLHTEIVLQPVADVLSRVLRIRRGRQVLSELLNQMLPKLRAAVIQSLREQGCWLPSLITNPSLINVEARRAQHVLNVRTLVRQIDQCGNAEFFNRVHLICPQTIGQVTPIKHLSQLRHLPQLVNHLNQRRARPHALHLHVDHAQTLESNLRTNQLQQPRNLGLILSSIALEEELRQLGAEIHAEVSDRSLEVVHPAAGEALAGCVKIRDNSKQIDVRVQRGHRQALDMRHQTLEASTLPLNLAAQNTSCKLHYRTKTTLTNRL